MKGKKTGESPWSKNWFANPCVLGPKKKWHLHPPVTGHNKESNQRAAIEASELGKLGRTYSGSRSKTLHPFSRHCTYIKISQLGVPNGSTFFSMAHSTHPSLGSPHAFTKEGRQVKGISGWTLAGIPSSHRDWKTGCLAYPMMGGKWWLAYPQETWLAYLPHDGW